MKTANKIKQKIFQVTTHLKTAFSKPPKSKLIALFFFSFLVAIVSNTTPFIASTYFRNNIAISLAETYDSFKTEHKDDSFFGGALYKYPLDTKDEICYNNPELPREFREIYSKNQFLDAYINGWDSKYSPARVEINGSKKGFSLLLIPKERYVYNKWDERYSIPLLYPNNVQARTSPNDIYITKEYADELLSKNIATSYDDLIDKAIEVPYYWNTESTQFTKNVFVVKGILDTESERYKSYKQIFGDFFVVNEYFTMPMPSVTMFSFGERKDLLLLFETLLKKYDYETIKSNYSSTSSSFSFQTRITFVTDFESEYSIQKIMTSNSKYQIIINKIFDSFSNVSYIIYSVILISVNISFVLLLLFLLFQIVKLFEKNDRKMIKICLFTELIISTIIAFCIKSIIGQTDLFSFLSLNNYFGAIIAIAELVIIVVFLFLVKREKTDY